MDDHILESDHKLREKQNLVTLQQFVVDGKVVDFQYFDNDKAEDKTTAATLPEKINLGDATLRLKDWLYSAPETLRGFQQGHAELAQFCKVISNDRYMLPTANTIFSAISKASLVTSESCLSKFTDDKPSSVVMETRSFENYGAVFCRYLCEDSFKLKAFCVTVFDMKVKSPKNGIQDALKILALTSSQITQIVDGTGQLSEDTHGIKVSTCLRVQLEQLVLKVLQEQSNESNGAFDFLSKIIAETDTLSNLLAFLRSLLESKKKAFFEGQAQLSDAKLAVTILEVIRFVDFFLPPLRKLEAYCFPTIGTGIRMIRMVFKTLTSFEHGMATECDH